MTLSRLTSRDNPLLKTIRLITSGSRRAPECLVIAEGIRVLEEVCRSPYKIQAVVCSDRFGSSDKEQLLLCAWHSQNVRLYRVPERLFRSVSDVRSPQGALALVRVPEVVLPDVPSGRNSLILFACGIQDPGNLGTLIRTAVASGATLICTSEGTVSARMPKSIRSSAGAFFRLPPVEHVRPIEFRRYCRRNSIQIYRTDPAQGILYTQADLRSSSAVLLGNEGSGMTVKEFVDLPALRIPMADAMESLNVAAAGAVILFEAARQRSLRVRAIEG